VREQVITPRAGRAAAKGRGAVSVQRPNTRKASKDSRQSAFDWKSALAYFPAVLKAVLAVSLGLLAYLGYRTAVSTSFFKVRAVDVAGATRASREDIRSAVLRLSNAGVWQADLDTIARELKGLPWVRDAVVTRVLPGGLRVRVTEREPRVIARASNGRLVWVDEEGVPLGAASPDEEDFFVRGIDEGRGTESAKHNRARVEVARALAREWAQAGLTGRVSELNLEDLNDVRVQLAGQDAAVELRLGKEEFVKRFRQALAVLDAQRLTPRGPFVTYVDVSQGKRAVVGTGTTAQYQPAEAVEPATAEPEPTAAPSAQAAEAARAPSRPAPAAAKAAKAAKVEKAEKKSPASRPTPVRVAEKKAGAPLTSKAAVRPRRVDEPETPEE
jgi:cell division protein FtsQ